MNKHFCCPQCGNLRGLFPDYCEFCGSLETPFAQTSYIKVDLEKGMPTVEEAISYFQQYLFRSEELGVRALLVLHGYGSSGEGGRIRRRFRELLESNEWANRIDEFVYGETAHHLKSLKLSATLKKELEKERFSSNPGCTLLLLKHIDLHF
ncbi:MAG: Smr/MutS family protein [Betaproteobacteria bacterium]|nr:Smr/MutS family protein [Betaproteobacteria bacterium]MDE2423818.1 Smr/MutS family protein [Betaproteobacteria bacterium]